MRGGAKSEQARHHELNLFLGRTTGADDGLLYLGGRELVDAETGLRAGEEHYAAGVSEDDGSADVARVEDILDGEHVRVVALNELDYSVEDVLQTYRQRVARAGANHSTFHEHGQARGVDLLDDAIAGSGSSGIDS
jgi:hypothetical protein